MRSRRAWLRGAATIFPGLAGARLAHGQQGTPRVVVIGGGFGGASCARALKAADPVLDVTLIEPNGSYTACPFSNLVLGGYRRIADQQFSYGALATRGIRIAPLAASDVDATRRVVTLSDSTQLPYDRLVLAPGIDIDWRGLPGYDAAAAERMPHAWRAGAQTMLLRRQLEALPDGGVVAMSVPQAPYRCPPGPYERASLIASYLKQHKPAAKLLILDAKDSFSKQALFQQGWQALYGSMIEWAGAADGAAVIEVNARNKSLITDFDRIEADVANVIPPQRAGAIAVRAGVTDASGWCPIEAATFESTLVPGIHVIGDAAIANAMPKSAFAANAQARLCAVQVVRLLRGDEPGVTKLVNTCYSLLNPTYGISVAGVYTPTANGWTPVPGAGGASDLDAPATYRRLEARYAGDWFAAITGQVFG